MGNASADRLGTLHGDVEDLRRRTQAVELRGARAKRTAAELYEVYAWRQAAIDRPTARVERLEHPHVLEI